MYTTYSSKLFRNSNIEFNLKINAVTMYQPLSTSSNRHHNSRSRDHRLDDLHSQKRTSSEASILEDLPDRSDHIQSVRIHVDPPPRPTSPILIDVPESGPISDCE